MSKIVSIKEDEHSRIFAGINKLVTNTAEGGTATWVPEDEAADYTDKKALSVTENGTYKAPEGSVFDKVDVNVTAGSGEDDSDYNFIASKEITRNGIYKASDDAGSTSKQSGYEEVTVNLPFTSKTITKNATYNAADELDSMGNPCVGFSSIDVQVDGASTGRQISKTIRKNGTYKPEDEPDDGNGKIVGYNQVDVALPLMEKKVIDHGGKFRPQSEQDENGNEYQGYKSIAVNIKITQPVMDFTMNVDHQLNALNVFYNLSISNTDPRFYLQYENDHTPVVDFSNAKLIFHPGEESMYEKAGEGPFNLSKRFLRTPPFSYEWNGQNYDVKTLQESYDWGAKKFIRDGYNWYSYHDGGEINQHDPYNAGFSSNIADITGEGKGRNISFMRFREWEGKLLMIFCGQFRYGPDNKFSIVNYWKKGDWEVSNISFNEGDYYSFTITVNAPHA